MVRLKKQTLFLDATEETTILQVKKMLEAITKKFVEEQQLHKVDMKEPLNDSRTIGDVDTKALEPKLKIHQLLSTI